jgi:hypothetical protein
MPLTVAERNAIADFEAARLVYVSLHTADPGTTGAAEATGGTPAYARKALSFGAASSGTATAGEVTFDVPPGTYTHFGVWTAVTSGTFRGGNPLSATTTINPQGQIKLTIAIPVAAS